jgi:hypothetical protein
VVKILERLEMAWLSIYQVPLRMDFADPETALTILPFTKFEITGESEMLLARLFAHVSGTVNQELLLRNEYLAAENRILRGRCTTEMRSSAYPVEN